MSQYDLRKLCFDMILVRKSGDAYNPISLDAFVALPIDERVSMIMAKRVRFFSDETEVPVYQAIKSLDDAQQS